MKKYLNSKNRLRKLRVKLHEIKEEMQECIADMGISGNNDKDLIENPEFMRLRTKVDYELPQKIARLQQIIGNSSLIEDQPEIKEGNPDYVLPGCVVDLESDDGTRTIHILGVEESEPEFGIVSYETPVGSALLNLEEGDEVTLPSKGRQVKYEIGSIRVSEYLLNPEERHD